MDKRWTVYKHVAPNGKAYIGITCNKLQYRWGPEGKNYLIIDGGRGYRHPIFANAILKYGWNNFTHEIILENISRSEAIYTEKYLVRWYKIHNISYNATDGGDGTVGLKLTKEQCQKVSKRMKEWHKNHSSPMLGRHHTKEAKENISINHRHFQTAETREKISSIQMGKKFPQWRKSLLSDAHAKERIPVVQLTKDNQYVATYNSIMDAQRATGIYNALIAQAIKRRCSAKGFKWLNKKDYDN